MINMSGIMNSKAPVIIIEDDPDDQDVLKEVFAKLKYGNELLFFSDGYKTLQYLNSTDVAPFLMLCDINMPKMDGFTLKEKIEQDPDLNLRCIPYIYFSTNFSRDTVEKAYQLSAQGFFKKLDTQQELQATISVIMEYWSRCATPANC